MESRKLPFLQSQILDYIYLSIYKNKNLSIENISELTGYPTKSKILSNAINSLVKKEFLEEKDKFIFSVPENRQTFFKERIMEINNAEKAVYDTDCINLIDSDDKQLPLFNRINSLDDLKQLNIIHQWYDYLENFPFSLLEESIEKYNLSPENLIFDPFCGSGTTLVSGKL